MDWSQAIKCETEVARIITQQGINGVLFDLEGAHQLINTIRRESEEIYDYVRPYLPYVKDTKKRTCMRPFNVKTGGYSKKVEKLLGDDELPISGAFTYIAPSLGSREYLVNVLIDLGWKPDQFTETGRPKLTHQGAPVESLSTFDNDLGQRIGRWYIINHRRSQVQGWINKLRPDGRLSALAVPIGTNTNRMRHSIVVNVPKAADHVPYGHEMRALFIVPEGYRMIGHDASGLELRMLAHYLNDPEYTRVVTEGDPHSLHQEMAGLPTRDDAKTFIYAFLYGAGDTKLGSIIAPLASQQEQAAHGARLRATFLNANPKLKELVDRVKKASRTGYLIGLDGRKIWMRKDKRGRIMEHKALNTLLQSAGAVVMKYSMIFLDKWVRKEGLDVKKVIDMHDEAQAEVKNNEKIIELYCHLAVQSIRQAELFLELNCPLDAEAKVGHNWSETH